MSKCGKEYSLELTESQFLKGKYKHFCIDYDHKTLKFRGLLCSVCNRQLGWYENNKEKIERYLNKNKWYS